MTAGLSCPRHARAGCRRGGSAPISAKGDACGRCRTASAKPREAFSVERLRDRRSEHHRNGRKAGVSGIYGNRAWGGFAAKWPFPARAIDLFWFTIPPFRPEPSTPQTTTYVDILRLKGFNPPQFIEKKRLFDPPTGP